jgi:hypothetical protein
MHDLLVRNPWLIPACLGGLIPIVAIIFGTVTRYLHKARQAELDAALKHEMIRRGMSAEEIVQVLEARSKPAKKRAGDKTPQPEMADFPH